MAFDFKSAAAASAVQAGNPYLANDDRALTLAAQLISAKARQRPEEQEHIDHLIDDQLLAYAAHLHLEDELALANRLEALSDRLSLTNKYRMFKDRSVIGVGGKFSAGKSAFLNSLLGEEYGIRLPEKQTPSTAVPTYILNGPKKAAFAYNAQGAALQLDMDMVEAISHVFESEHGLKLAPYLDFLALQAPDFPQGIALLDTPGYNKAAGNERAAYTDEAKAYAQLRSIDRLIWLVDVSNGVLDADDMDFLRRLNLPTKPLIIVNKCDLRPQEDVANVVAAVRDAAQSNGFEIYDVLPYSAASPDDYTDAREAIQRFLSDEQGLESRAEDIGRQVEQVAEEFNAHFPAARQKMKTQQERLGSALEHAERFLDSKAMVERYVELGREQYLLDHDQRHLAATLSELRTALQREDTAAPASGAGTAAQPGAPTAADTFALLAKLCDTANPQPDAARTACQELTKAVNGELAALLADSDYPQRAALDAQIDDVLEGIDLFLRYPVLAGRTAVGILTGSGKLPKALEKQLAEQTFGYAAGLPCILSDALGKETVQVTSRTGNVLSISNAELKVLNGLPKHHIETADVAKSCLTTTTLRHSCTNYILLPPQERAASLEYRQLAALCQAFFLLFDPEHPVEIPGTVLHGKANTETPILVFCQPGQENACKAYLDKYRKLRGSIDMRPLAELPQMLAFYDRQTDNCLFVEQLRVLLFTFQAYAAARVKHLKQITAGLTKDDLLQNERDNRTKGVLKQLREENVEAGTRSQTQLAKFRQLRAELVRLTNSVRRALLGENGSGISAPPAMYTLRAQLVLLALELGDRELAVKTRSQLPQSYPYGYILDLYIEDKKERGSSSSPASKESAALGRLRTESSENELVLRAKLHFAYKLGLSREACEILAARLPEAIRDAHETYLAAHHTETAVSLEAALKLYKKALRQGSVQAGEVLLSHYADPNKNEQLAVYADMGIPKADYLLGKSLLANKQTYWLGVRYLRIAAALEHWQAALDYGDYLFTLVMDKQAQNMKAAELRADPDFATALYLYGCINNCVYSTPLTKVRQGILLYLNGEYPRAKPLLQRHPDGDYYLGCMYRYGNGVTKDLDKATKYLEKAKAHGDERAGDMLEKVERSKREAEKKAKDAYDEDKDYSSRTSNYSSDSGGSLGGAAIGAAIGGAIGGPLGAAIGGLFGGLFG